MQPTLNTKNRILAVARDLFHSRSYADVGIQEICALSKVQKGSFYHFFPSKQDLAVAVIDNMAEDWATGFVAESFDPNLTPMERLEYMVDAIYYWQKAAKDIDGRLPGCLFGNLALELSTRDDVLRAKLRAVFDKASYQFRQALDEAVAAGSLPPLHTELTALAMLAYLEGVILIAKTQNDPELIRLMGSAVRLIRVEIE
ncbi:TetR/AcrR family transcriptional regulator [Ectothiorhodospiraceae bacterium BW-2]|nr:TetR/AcrR family transcriptional regulator [Ectothiorhodospiraceae bacterium BW-2]